MFSIVIKFAIVIVAVAINACSDKETPQSSSDISFTPEVRLELNDIQSDGCINLEKLMTSMLRSPNIPARKIVRNVSSSSYKGRSVPYNFSVRTAYGAFLIDDKFLNQINDFRPAIQQDCKTVLFPDNKGGEVYKITQTTSDSITVSGAWDDVLTYKWSSPHQVIVTHSFVGADPLCNDITKVRFTVVNHIYWGPNAQSELISPKSFNSDYISTVAKATDYPLSSIYVYRSDDDLDENDLDLKMISVAKIRELATSPVKPEILNCR